MPCRIFAVSVIAGIALSIHALVGCTCCDDHDGAGSIERAPADRVADATLYNASGHSVEAPAASVATFDRTRVLIAYCRSPKHDAILRGLIARRDAAKARGDRDGVRACEREGHAMQAHAHRQLAGKAPLDDVAANYREEIATIARDAGVGLVIARDAYTSADPTIDVTDKLEAAMRTPLKNAETATR